MAATISGFWFATSGVEGRRAVAWFRCHAGASGVDAINTCGVSAAHFAFVRFRFMLDVSGPVAALRFQDAVPVGPRQQFREVLYTCWWVGVLSWSLVDCERGRHVAGAALRLHG